MKTPLALRVLPGLTSAGAMLLALATLVEAVANRRLYSIVLLPSYERLLEVTWLALGFAVLTLLWRLHFQLAGTRD